MFYTSLGLIPETIFNNLTFFFAATLAKLQPQINQNGPQATEKSRLEKNISYVRLRQCWKSAAEAAFKSIQFANTSAENLVWNLQIRSAKCLTALPPDSPLRLVEKGMVIASPSRTPRPSLRSPSISPKIEKILKVLPNIRNKC